MLLGPGKDGRTTLLEKSRSAGKYCRATEPVASGVSILAKVSLSGCGLLGRLLNLSKSQFVYQTGMQVVIMPTS